jgi:SAM-dependent methyltransferase
MSLKETYNQIAEDWHKDHQKDDWWVEGTNKFISLLKPKALVLDVGCGSGTKSKYFVERGFQLVGIDFSEKMIEIAKREVSEARFVVSDLADVSKINDIFDGIFIQAVLLHIPKSQVLQNLSDLMKKLNGSGYLYIAVKEKRTGNVEEEIKVESDYGYTYERFFSYFTKDEIESYMHEIGCEVVYSEIKSSGKTNWVQVIVRKFK